MAGFSNIATMLMPTIQGIGYASSLMRFANDMNGASSKDERSRLQAQQNLALQQLQQRQEGEMRLAQEDAEQKRAQIAFDAQGAEDARRAALKRAVARQRATFGASGIDANSSGSAQAVLLGLYDESESERSRREELDTLRYGALDQGLAQRNSTNVLERTQLAQQQQLQQSLVGYGKNQKTLLGRFFSAF